MNTKLVKKVISLLLMLMILFALFSYEISVASSDWVDPIVNNQINATGDANIVGKTRIIMGTAVVVARVVCVGIAFIMLIVLGIKYVSSAPSDRATVMKHAVVYVVGAIVMFASSGILGLIQGFASNLNTP